MKTGNNYSGPRWLYSKGQRRSAPKSDEPSGVSLSGGSSRPTEIIRRQEDDSLAEVHDELVEASAWMPRPEECPECVEPCATFVRRGDK